MENTSTYKGTGTFESTGTFLFYRWSHGGQAGSSGLWTQDDAGGTKQQGEWPSLIKLITSLITLNT